MEIESENGTKITVEKGEKREIGRRESELGFNSNLSRKQICLSLQNTRVVFEVIGKNPIWVYEKSSDEIKVFKRYEKGEMVDGDMFCFYGKIPVWFTVRESGCLLDLDLELGFIDVSALDPVKEFGFLVIGHELDHYPKPKITPPKTWDWFLEESKKGSNDDDAAAAAADDDDDDDETENRNRCRSTRRKRKKGDRNDDDDEWTGESEEDKELISKTRKVQRPKYSTRSKDCDKPAKDNRKSKSPTQKKVIKRNEEEDEGEGDEEDDTLGGFIVTDDEVKEEEDDDDETELDEEFEDDDNED